MYQDTPDRNRSQRSVFRLEGPWSESLAAFAQILTTVETHEGAAQRPLCVADLEVMLPPSCVTRSGLDNRQPCRSAGSSPWEECPVSLGEGEPPRVTITLSFHPVSSLRGALLYPDPGCPDCVGLYSSVPWEGRSASNLECPRDCFPSSVPRKARGKGGEPLPPAFPAPALPGGEMDGDRGPGRMRKF